MSLLVRLGCLHRLEQTAHCVARFSAEGVS